MCALSYSALSPMASRTRLGSLRCAASHSVVTSMVSFVPCAPQVAANAAGARSAASRIEIRCGGMTTPLYIAAAVEKFRRVLSFVRRRGERLRRQSEIRQRHRRTWVHLQFGRGDHGSLQLWLQQLY